MYVHCILYVCYVRGKYAARLSCLPSAGGIGCIGCICQLINMFSSMCYGMFSFQLHRKFQVSRAAILTCIYSVHTVFP